MDTGVFAQDRYVEVVTDWAKAGPRDICMRIRLTNKGPESVTQHVLPSVWFRNTWSWRAGAARPELHSTGAGLAGQHAELGEFAMASTLIPSDDANDEPPDVLCCENETNVRRLFGSDQWAGSPATPYPKDGINDHIVNGLPTVNPAGTGTKGAVHHVVLIEPGETREVRARLVVGTGEVSLGDDVEELMAARAAEADEFYSTLLDGLPSDTASVARQALAGLLASKQFYAYDVQTWLMVIPSNRIRHPSGCTAERRLAPPERRRRDPHAGLLGVSVVRLMGSRVPGRGAGPR